MMGEITAFSSSIHRDKISNLTQGKRLGTKSLKIYIMLGTFLIRDKTVFVLEQ